MDNHTLQEIEVALNLSVLHNLGYDFKRNNLQKIVIPKNYDYNGNRYKITKVGERTFLNAVSLQEIEFPDSIIEIGESAFEGCSSLQKIEFPKNLVKIGEYAFSGCKSLQTEKFSDTITEIGESAFEGCSSLQKIELPKNLTKINKYTFSDCESLQEIVFPDSITEIGERSFEACSSLQKIELPKNLTKINRYTFSVCAVLQEVKLPDSITEIGEYAFWSCKSLQKIDIPKNLTKIGPCAFGGCELLKGIKFPDSVTEISEYVFSDSDNDSEKKPELSSNDVVREKEEEVFGEFNEIKEKIKDDSKTKKAKKKDYLKELKGIGIMTNIYYTIFILVVFSFFLPLFTLNNNRIFYSFFKYGLIVLLIWILWSIWKPEYWKSKKKNTIREATLTDNVLESLLGYKKYNDSVNNCTIIYYNGQEVTSLNIPNVYDDNGEKRKITKIGKNVFSNCKRLIEVKIPDSITKIDNNAFLNCTNLKKINIPDSLKEIKEDSFFGCNALLPEIRKKINNKITSDYINSKYINIETNDNLQKTTNKILLYIAISIVSLFVIDRIAFLIEGINDYKIFLIGLSLLSVPIFIAVIYICACWPNKCEVNNVTLYKIGYKNKFNVTSIEIPKTYTVTVEYQTRRGGPYTTRQDKYKLIRIGDNTFKNCKKIQKITIPDSISEIGKNAFSGCTGLVELVIPDSVFEIGENAFKDVENVVYNGNAIGSPWGAKNISRR